MNDRGQGRKPLNKSGELMKSRPIRMTDAEWEKCKKLGGAAWLREKIKRATLPTDQQEPTRGQKLAAAGHNRRPSWRALPADDDTDQAKD